MTSPQSQLPPPPHAGWSSLPPPPPPPPGEPSTGSSHAGVILVGVVLACLAAPVLFILAFFAMLSTPTGC